MFSASTSVTSFKGAVLRRLRKFGAGVQAIEPQFDRADRAPLCRESLSALFELDTVEVLHRPNAFRKSESVEHDKLNDMRGSLYSD